MKPINKFSMIPIFIILSCGATTFPIYAQIESSPIQQQESPHGITMQFSYMPPIPAINGFTTFQFNVINSTKNQLLQNYTATVIVGNVAGFTGGSSYYNFSKIVVPNGNFSVNYAFPNDGTFPINLRVDTANYIDVGRFQVIVPPPTNAISGGNLIYIGAGVAAAGAVAGVVIMLARKSSNKKV